MDQNVLKFNNLEKALNDFLNDFVENYRRELVNDGKKATGNLIRSIKNYGIEFNNGKVYGEISIADYWKYVEYGRRPGKFPPINKILAWVKVKPILPRPQNGLKPPTQEQIAFLVARKIAREGIKPGNQFTTALGDTWKRHEKRISDAITLDLQQSIDLIVI